MFLPGVNLVDSATSVAKEVKEELSSEKMLRDKFGNNL